MPPDAIDRAVAEARTTKRLWLWGSMGTALVAWLIVWWVSSHRGTMILPNGTVISYAGVHKGKRVSEAEFERDVYTYPGELISPTPLAERLNRFIYSLTHPRRGYVSHDEYSYAPELLLLHVSKIPPSAKDFRLTLEDGFGQGQLMTNPHMPRSIWLNHEPLPMGSPSWKIKVWGENNLALGELVLPNPSFKNTPRFAGKSPPLEAKNSKNILGLVSASHSFTEAEASVRWRQVTLEFDASACPTLLPCHTIGVRVTDAWGNTGFSGASTDRDGKTVRAVFRMESGTGDVAMQSEDWHIKIALCRGYGASFKAGELVVFDHFLSKPGNQTPVTKLIAGRLLTLENGFWADGPRPNQWSLCRFKWRLDPKDPAVWPVLVKATGRTMEGAVIDIDSITSEKPYERSSYGVIRERFLPAGCDSWKLTDFPLFEASFMSPPELKDFDLHVALEEPQVFEFYAKISNWPTPPSESKP